MSEFRCNMPKLLAQAWAGKELVILHRPNHQGKVRRFVIKREEIMNFEDVYNFFREARPQHLNKELATCFCLSVLLSKDTWGTELIQTVESGGQYLLTDRILYSALKFLEGENVISGYWKSVEGQDRPRRMYQLMPEHRERAEEMAELWSDWLGQQEQGN